METNETLVVLLRRLASQLQGVAQALLLSPHLATLTRLSSDGWWPVQTRLVLC